MNCVREDLKAHITDVLVGEAETPVSEQVLSHLETCASCREDRNRMTRAGEVAAATSLAAVARMVSMSIIVGLPAESRRRFSGW